MSEQENEKEAVRTTIVGGRPPGSGRSNIAVPRGIEVLVKKAAVDPEFRELLFAQRGAAAAAVELELDPAENAMLNAIPQEQLAQIVSQTTVPVEQRRAFLGRIATVMLAALGGYLAGCKPSNPTLGSTSDRPPSKLQGTRGIQPDRPVANPPTTNQTPQFRTWGIEPDRPKSTDTNVTVEATLGIRPDRP